MNHTETIFEQLGGTYTQVGDYLLPNLTIDESEQQSIGKYGRMRKRYTAFCRSAHSRGMGRGKGGMIFLHRDRADRGHRRKEEILTT